MASYAYQPLDFRAIKILDVRVPTDREFNIYKDRTFWILM